MRFFIWAAFMVCYATAQVFAHFPILIHDAPLASEGQEVRVIFAVGHPYEQDYEDAEKPAELTAILPSGKKVSLLETLQVGHSEKNVKAWSLTYKPTQKGDTLLALSTVPDISGNSIYQEFIKTYIHVEQQDGWRNRSGQPLEFMPLTRPYGVEPGDVFTGRLMKGDEPVSGIEVYIEHFEEEVPEMFPAEPFITKVVVTDPNGVFSCTLPSAGWWICAAYVDDVGKAQHEGKEYNLNALAGLWVNVSEAE